MLPMAEKKISLLIASYATALCLLTGCGGGGAAESGSPGAERSVATPLSPAISRPEPTAEVSIDPLPDTLLNKNQFVRIKADAAWSRTRPGSQKKGYTGDGVVIGILEAVNSFHPELANKIHKASVFGSPYPLGAPVPDEKFIVDQDDFTKYPVVPCLLQFGLDCPDDSGDDKYFLRRSNGKLLVLPGVHEHCNRVPGRTIPCQRVNSRDAHFDLGHGSLVASVAAADGRDNILLGRTGSTEKTLSLQGVAPDAEILVYSHTLTGPGSNIATMRWLLRIPKQADVYNYSISYGIPVWSNTQSPPYGMSLIAHAMEVKGKPFIIATANHKEAFPRLPAAFPLFFPELRGQLLAVTAVGEDGQIARYANRCGTLPPGWNAAQYGRHYCLAAPADFWAAGNENDGYWKNNGTSLSTPVVTGAFAILKEQFDGNLSDDDIIYRLVSTADNKDYTDEGGPDYSDVAVYGAGLLDLGAATAPVGTQRMSAFGDINGGISYEFDVTSLTTSAAFGDALQRAFQNHEVAAFDELNAPFWYPLSSLTPTTSIRETLQERHARLFDRDNNAPVETAFGGRLALTSTHTGSYEQIDMSLRQPVDSIAQTELLLTAGDLSTAPLGLHEDKSFAHPYLHFAGEGIGLGGSLQLGAGRLTAMGFTSGGASGGASVPEDVPVEAQGGLLEYALEPFAGVGLGLQAGAMMEESRALGLLPEGGFGALGESSTAFAGISLDSSLEDSWRFRASMLFGRTNLDGPSVGLLKTSTSLASSAFRFALEGSGVLLDVDRIDIFVAQPLRIENGEASFVIPVGRTPSGLVRRERISGVSLEPGGRELEFGTRYEMQVREDIVATGGVGIVHEGGHSKRTETELYGLANLRFQF
ncbi:MAG: S8 family serine peptidase [Hyphomicrobiales bacterium]|nr:S8 family serine peptidase [Hyphomicrobiales bacterium]